MEYFRWYLPSLLPTEYPSVITVENSDGCVPSVMFSREFFCHASPSVILSVFRRWLVFLLFLTELATERGITDD